ncbi:MAG: helix-turn-helix transcriptional regulator, partial [Actinobacteria bacterium]|nr:helix-turn-helix transcriptional regulator [Actinomycetota bacterium]
MSEFSEAFGERLLVARFNYRHISQEALAERAGIHRTQISLLEMGQRQPLLETFVRLAGACG